jgi:hypothetical protein
VRKKKWDKDKERLKKNGGCARMKNDEMKRGRDEKGTMTRKGRRNGGG